MQSSGPFSRAFDAWTGTGSAAPGAAPNVTVDDDAHGSFGRYELVGKIGEGTLTEVFLARQDAYYGQGVPCALKRVKRALCTDIPLVSRFIEEARVAVRFDHPYVVKVHDFGQVAGVYYLAVEHVAGGRFDELLRWCAAHGQPLPIGAALHVARAVALGVDHAHGQKGIDRKPLGIVHGDVRPRNVLIGNDGAVKLTGFSFKTARARRALDGDEDALRYQAPEVLFGAASTEVADVWSIGVLLHEALTGEPLFAPPQKAADPAILVELVQRWPIPRPSSLRRDVTPALDAVVTKALTRSAGERFETAAALADALGELLDARPFAQPELESWLASLDEDAASTQMRPRARRPAPVELAPTIHDDDDSGSDDLSRAPTLIGRGPRLQVASSGDAALQSLGDELVVDPSLWALVRLGDRLVEVGRPDDARAAFRAAAGVFAFRGHLVQALCAFDGARTLSPVDAVRDDLHLLGALVPGDGQGFMAFLDRVDGRRYWNALRGRADEDSRPRAARTPFLGALEPAVFARLADAARVKRLPAGVHVLREGEPGDALYAVGHGRLVVTCTPAGTDAEEDHGFDAVESTQSGARLSDVVESAEAGAARRVFLSALSDGDFFGEFSFLTGRPRSASVETATPTRLLEISRKDAGSLIDAEPLIREPLLSFYKERVVEWMMAKNAVFSLLDAEARRELLHRCGLVDVPAGTSLVREGELHDAMYFLKRGEVEILSNDDGVPVFINKLGPGEFFGEMAALTGGPRTASVRAITDLEVFRIARADLFAILERAPEVRERMLARSALRSAEIKARVAETRKLLGST